MTWQNPLLYLILKGKAGKIFGQHKVDSQVEHNSTVIFLFSQLSLVFP
jgi:hypothetical protein